MALTRREEILASIEHDLEKLAPKLDPLLAERDELIAMKSALTGAGSRARGSRPAPRTASPSSGSTGQGHGPRQKVFLEIVQQHPEGITVADVVSQMNDQGQKVAKPYGYRMRATLEKAGLIRREGPKVMPVDPEEAALATRTAELTELAGA